jgi:tetrahydromethanopterin S-methyltransferase subunit G
MKMALFDDKKKDSNETSAHSPNPNNPGYNAQQNPQHPSQKGNLFKDSDSKLGMKQISKLAERLDNMESKLRLIENKVSLSNKKEGTMEDNFIGFKRDTLKRIMEIESEIGKVRDSIDDLNEKLKQMISEIKMKGSKADMEAIKKYLEYWKPIEFTTRETVRKMIDKAWEKKKRR